MFRFEHIEFLFLLFVIPALIALFVYGRMRRRRNLKIFGNPLLLAELMPNVSDIRPKIKFCLQLVIIVLLVFVLAQPQFGTKTEKEKRQGIEIMVALDVSNSMMAQDVAPNRLENAKQVLSRLIDDMDNDRVGLVVFAGDAYVQLPITVDYVSAKMFLSHISPKLVPRQGTAIGSAIDLCIKSFGEKSEKGRSIILITDGENHEDDALGAAKLARESGITISVIGMGKPDGSPIPIEGTMSFLKDREGNVVVSRLNEEMCRQIAGEAGGAYVRADNTNSAYRTVSQELDKIAKSEIETETFSDFNEQYQSFAWLALIIIILEFFIFDRRNKILSRFKIFEIKDKNRKQQIK